MYISKYQLDLTDVDVIEALKDLNKMHKYSWSFFVDVSDYGVSRENLELLYKIQEVNNAVYLIMQSKMKPNHIPSSATEIYLVDDVVLVNKIKNAETLGFHVFVNPTYKKPNTNKRYSLVKSKERVEWLKKYLSYNGCELISVSELDFSYRDCLKDTAGFKVGVSNMQGRLKVTDLDKFITLLKKGLGRGKSYGMGLLTFGT